MLSRPSSAPPLKPDPADPFASLTKTAAQRMTVEKAELHEIRESLEFVSQLLRSCVKIDKDTTQKRDLKNAARSANTRIQDAKP